MQLPTSTSLLDFSGLYVATTVADQPMNRIPVGPLAFRAKAHFSVHPEELVSPQGESSVLLDSSGGLKAGKATWTIDRVVRARWSRDDSLGLGWNGSR